MRRLLLLLVILICCVALAVERAPRRAPAPAPAAQGDAPAGQVRFETLDIWLDSNGHPLTAYQVEMRYDKTRVKIVGVEGGDCRAFNPAPYYDPMGLSEGRIIIGAFTTTHEDAPIGRMRVARLHLRVAGSGEHYGPVRLMAAASPGGERLIPVVHVIKAK